MTISHVQSAWTEKNTQKRLGRNKSWNTQIKAFHKHTAFLFLICTIDWYNKNKLKQETKPKKNSKNKIKKQPTIYY